ncbi:MAG: DUF2589 domain-containing protein [Firmicutes bacterium]|nr:DUF2589 domain-containing protein [Bacillota bacterium]
MAVDNLAAQTATSALQAIPFSSLIGGPLDACINAQAKAAQTSWEFIDRVGLTKDPVTGEKKAVNVSFQYNKNGEMVNLVVPLLTIVPIPFLAINRVIVDFKANISASSSSVSSTSTSEDLSAGGSAQGKIGWGPFSLSFEAHANYSSKKDSKASQESKYSVEYTMDVHVEGGQADMPAGLAAILNILQSAVTEAPAGGGVLLSPKNAVLQAAKDAKVYIEATAKDSHGVLQKGSKITFKLANPTGIGLKIQATRGTQINITDTDAIINADEKGVAGITIVVDKVPPEAPPGLIKLDVDAEVVNANDPAGGKNIISAAGAIRTTAGLPAPKNILTADVKFITTFENNKKLVRLTLKDSNGNPVPNKAIIASGYDVGVCTLDASKMLTGSDGTAAFTVTRVANGTTIITFADENGADTMVNVTVNANKLAPDKSSVTVLNDEGEDVVLSLATYDGQAVTKGSITARVTNPAVCKTDSPVAVNADGIAIFKVKKAAPDAAGSTDIEFSDDTGARVRVNVTVKPNTLTAESKKLTDVDEQAGAKVKLALKDGEGNATKGTITYSIDRDGVCSVTPASGTDTDNNGNIEFTVKKASATATGSAKITFKDKTGASVDVTVTVKK